MGLAGKASAVEASATQRGQRDTPICAAHRYQQRENDNRDDKANLSHIDGLSGEAPREKKTGAHDFTFLESRPSLIK
jgi:hypothetical protein